MNYKDKNGELMTTPKTLIGPDNNAELRCRATGCPSAWSVDSPDKGIHRLCSAHAWAPTYLWPQITQEQVTAQFDRQYKAEQDAAQVHRVRAPNEQERAALASLRQVLTATDPKAWARALQLRHEGGEHLNPNQIRCYQNALGLL